MHCKGKDNIDVKCIVFENIPLKWFPRGMNKLFPNVIAVEIYECGLETIEKEDLVGLKGLEVLLLANNNLRTLNSDLFEHAPVLQRVSFNENKLEMIAADLLDRLAETLTCARFRNNKNIDAFYNTESGSMGVSLGELKEIFKNKCTPQETEGAKSILKNVRSIWLDKHFSDFTIRVEDEIFSVHRWILGSQSVVLNSIFLNHNHYKKKLSTFRITNSTKKAFKEFLEYIYMAKAPESSIEVFKIAEEYKVIELQSFCRQKILKDLNIYNGFEVYLLGKKCDDAEFINNGFEQIQMLFGDQILPDNLKNEPEKLKNLIEAHEEYENNIFDANEKLMKAIQKELN